jgi:hypothetical protein
MLMKQKVEGCSYCTRRRKLYKCEIRLSAHCKDCCANNCSGRSRTNLIDESFDMARELSASSWPSADSTRWAMKNLVGRIAQYLEQSCDTKLTKRKMIKEMFFACGIPRAKNK